MRKTISEFVIILITVVVASIAFFYLLGGTWFDRIGGVADVQIKEAGKIDVLDTEEQKVQDISNIKISNFEANGSYNNSQLREKIKGMITGTFLSYDEAAQEYKANEIAEHLFTSTAKVNSIRINGKEINITTVTPEDLESNYNKIVFNISIHPKYKTKDGAATTTVKLLATGYITRGG